MTAHLLEAIFRRANPGEGKEKPMEKRKREEKKDTAQDIDIIPEQQGHSLLGWSRRRKETGLGGGGGGWNQENCSDMTGEPPTLCYPKTP
jgi:hypothetical protein